MTVRAVVGVMAVVYLLNFAFYPEMSRAWSEVDMPMHFLGGFLAGLLGLACWAFVRERYSVKNVPAWVVAILAICFASVVATVWEFYEFGIDWYYKSRGLARSWQQPGLPDTMMDLFLGLVGAAVSTLTLMRRKKN